MNNLMVMDIQFLQAKASDKSYLLDLRLQTMVEHLESSGRFLTRQEHAERVAYRYEDAYLISIDKVIVGMLKYKVDKATVTIFQLQIAPKFQRRGHGSNAIECLISQHQEKTLSLTVLKKNPALTLYQNLGFCVVGEDKYEYHLEKCAGIECE